MTIINQSVVVLVHIRPLHATVLSVPLNLKPLPKNLLLFLLLQTYRTLFPIVEVVEGTRNNGLFLDILLVLDIFIVNINTACGLFSFIN